MFLVFVFGVMAVVLLFIYICRAMFVVVLDEAWLVNAVIWVVFVVLLKVNVVFFVMVVL